MRCQRAPPRRRPWRMCWTRTQRRSLWSLSQLRVDDSVSGFDDCSSGREESSRTPRHFVAFFFLLLLVQVFAVAFGEGDDSVRAVGSAQTMRILVPFTGTMMGVDKPVMVITNFDASVFGSLSLPLPPPGCPLPDSPSEWITCHLTLLPPSNSPLPIVRPHLPAGHERAQTRGTSEHTCTNEGCSVTEQCYR